MPRRVCIYGGPCCGKSTAAARVFAVLKAKGENVELVQEYVKSWAWEGRRPTGFEQLYIFAKQLRAEERLLKLGVSIITDSPLPMQLAYCLRDEPMLLPSLSTVCRLFELTYPGEHYVLCRTFPYISSGRYESEDEAKNVDVNIRAVLARESIAYTSLRQDELLSVFGGGEL